MQAATYPGRVDDRRLQHRAASAPHVLVAASSGGGSRNHGPALRHGCCCWGKPAAVLQALAEGLGERCWARRRGEHPVCGAVCGAALSWLVRLAEAAWCSAAGSKWRCKRAGCDWHMARAAATPAGAPHLARMSNYLPRPPGVPDAPRSATPAPKQRHNLHLLDTLPHNAPSAPRCSQPGSMLLHASSCSVPAPARPGGAPAAASRPKRPDRKLGGV